MTPAQRDISRKLRIFNYAKQIGNVSASLPPFRHFPRDLLPLEAGLRERWRASSG
jgi:hypothetical protein